MAARGCGLDAARLRRSLDALDASWDDWPHPAGKLDAGRVEHSRSGGHILEPDDVGRPDDVDRCAISVAAHRQLERGCRLGRNPGPGRLESSGFDWHGQLNRHQHDSGMSTRYRTGSARSAMRAPAGVAELRTEQAVIARGRPGA